MMLFCSHCHGYFPSGLLCPHCGRARPAVQAPTAPGKPLWEAQVPGSVAGRMAMAHVDGQAVLIVPWFHLPRRGEARPAGGGVSALEAGDGGVLWDADLGAPVEAGAAVAGDLVVAGTAVRGIAEGEGALVALDLRTGAERWRTRVGGAVRCAPAVDKVRVYAAAGDGFLYCLDARDGKQVWSLRLLDRPAPIPASPAMARERGVLQAILVGTYGGQPGRESGLLIAVDDRGRGKLLELPAGGHVRGSPAVVEGVAYVAAYRSGPSAGVLTAFDLRRGQPHWRQPFVAQAPPGDHRAHYFSASPLVHGGRVYVGSLNHRLYALDAATGELKWTAEVLGGIATTPAWVEGLLVFGSNDRHLYALDAETRRDEWHLPLRGGGLTSPLVEEGVIFVGDEEGSVRALPWHAGRHEWAAARLERAGRLSEAGDCLAAAAHFSPGPEAGRRLHAQAEDRWVRAGQPEKAAEMWLALGARPEAAEALRRAGHRWRTQDPPRAVACFRRAAELFFQLRLPDPLEECTRLLATCVELPLIEPRAANVPDFHQWEQGELTLRLLNAGRAVAAGGVRLWLGGALKTPVAAEIPSALAPGQAWNIPLFVTPTRRQSTLEVEIEYDSGRPECGPLWGMLAVEIEAVEQPKPALVIGDVGKLELTIAQATREGVAIVARDVGMVKSGGGVRSVAAEGSVGGVIAREGIGSVHAGGDVGGIVSRGRGPDG